MSGWMQGLSLLPAFLVVWSSATFIISYLLAILRRDTDVVFPYISDTSATPPESCIFGLMTFVAAYAGIATVYARFKFVERINEGANIVRPRLNTAALHIGVISCLGMVIVATFQETAVTGAHDAGALAFFIFGILYAILQTVISYCAHPLGTSICICRARLVFAVIVTAAFFPTFICAFFVKGTSLHRHKDDPDYPFHLASAVCEWIVSFGFIFFFCTYINEFKLFTLTAKRPQNVEYW
uniref:DNA-damage regulated autophagy modulator 1 n=1 Tax=Tetraodon nigroviridis TaxID=99883 RepID=H3C1K1_TETNG